MKVKVLFDKDALNKNLHFGWGVSFLVGETVLFDAGENGQWLLENMKNLNVDIQKIQIAVISHNHWDHTGGLWELLKKRPGLSVCACPNFSSEFKKRVTDLKGRLIEAKEVIKVSKNIFTTGEIPGEYKQEYMPEQALIAKTSKGLTVITGCAHPGIIQMLELIKKKFQNKRFYYVIGGFHLMEKDKRIIRTIADKFNELTIEKAGPTHCSGNEAEGIFKEKYASNFILIKTGQTLDI